MQLGCTGISTHHNILLSHVCVPTTFCRLHLVQWGEDPGVDVGRVLAITISLACAAIMVAVAALSYIAWR